MATGRSLPRPAYAETLGMPEHAGRVLGTADLVVPPELDPTSGTKGGDCEAEFGEAVDVALTDLDDIGPVAWDEDVVSLAPSAVLENVGTTAIRWYWAISPHGFNGTLIGQHPYLSMHLYRLDANGLQQIGLSDLKHAWNTINFNCPCDGGQIMYPGCADVYGVANNSNQFYFGPREELTAHRGFYNSFNSHFDATPVDNIRDHHDELEEHGRHDHLLSVPTAELFTPGARYFVEAWYVVQRDTNIWNSIAHREIRPTFEPANNLWSFPYIGPFRQGPAIRVLEDEGATLETVETEKGAMLLASEAFPTANGNRYRYTIMNMDFDQKVARLSLPAVRGAIRDVTFIDSDANVANDWRWQGGSTFGGGAGLDWGCLLSVAFTSDSFALSGKAVVDPAESGAVPSLTVTGPAVPLVLPTELPVLRIAPEITGAPGQLIRCTWTALPGASYDVQVSADNRSWKSRGITVIPRTTVGEYVEVPGEEHLNYRVQLIALP